MPVIPILNLKGGVAKTVTTVAIAECFASHGHRVLVIDADQRRRHRLAAKVGHEQQPVLRFQRRSVHRHFLRTEKSRTRVRLDSRA